MSKEIKTHKDLAKLHGALISIEYKDKILR